MTMRRSCPRALTRRDPARVSPSLRRARKSRFGLSRRLTGAYPGTGPKPCPMPGLCSRAPGLPRSSGGCGVRSSLSAFLCVLFGLGVLLLAGIVAPRTYGAVTAYARLHVVLVLAVAGLYGNLCRGFRLSMPSLIAILLSVYHVVTLAVFSGNEDRLYAYGPEEWGRAVGLASCAVSALVAGALAVETGQRSGEDSISDARSSPAGLALDLTAFRVASMVMAACTGYYILSTLLSARMGVSYGEAALFRWTPPRWLHCSCCSSLASPRGLRPAAPPHRVLHGYCSHATASASVLTPLSGR